ncbi:hypothetical protein LTR27_002214 [Elasticomyces elasticus]|nr:hypothetical protein LTR27_002214 [Elasticomyces elasticus]
MYTSKTIIFFALTTCALGTPLAVRQTTTCEVGKQVYCCNDQPIEIGLLQGPFAILNALLPDVEASAKVADGCTIPSGSGCEEDDVPVCCADRQLFDLFGPLTVGSSFLDLVADVTDEVKAVGIDCTSAGQT